jgi:hypothetical protein
VNRRRPVCVIFAECSPTTDLDRQLAEVLKILGVGATEVRRAAELVDHRSVDGPGRDPGPVRCRWGQFRPSRQADGEMFAMAAPDDSRLSRLASRTVSADSRYGARYPLNGRQSISRQGSHPVSCRTGRSVCRPQPGPTVSLATLTLGTGATITDVLESPTLAAGEDISPWIYTALAALIFRFWAVSAQNRRSGKRERQPGKIRIALLLYRLGGISASLVRIAFYASVAVAIWWLSKTVDFQTTQNNFRMTLPGSLWLSGLRSESGTGQSLWGQHAR